MRRSTHARIVTALTVMFLTIGSGVSCTQDRKDPPKGGDEPTKQTAVKLGLSINDPKAFQGYTLLAPMMSTKTYLLDMEGRVVRTWESDCNPGPVPLPSRERPPASPRIGSPDHVRICSGRGAGFRSSPGKANWSGISGFPTRRNTRTTTSAGCPTATC